MAKQTSLFLTKQFNSTCTFFQPADTTALKTIFTAGADDSIVKLLTVCSDDTASRIIQLWKTYGGYDYLLTTVTIPALSGFNGTAPRISLLNPVNMPGITIDKDGNYILQMKGTHLLKAAVTTTVTTAKTITIEVLGEDY